MPKSRVRKKAVYTPPPTRSEAKIPSPTWVAPTMIALVLIGIIWLVIFYLTSGDFFIMRSIGTIWNLVVGFIFIVAGLVLSTKWR